MPRLPFVALRQHTAVTTTSTSMPIRFDQFTFDEQSGELRNADGMTRLQPQASAALHVLLANAGQVVTRETMITALWPDTTVEFDDSLNFCIRQLRVALGDNATAPRFIETLPKRGYRFIAPIIADEPDAPFMELAAEPAPAPLRQSRYLMTGLFAAAYIGFRVYAHFMAPPEDIAPVSAEVAPVPKIVLAILPFEGDAANAAATLYRRTLNDVLVAKLTGLGSATTMSVVGPISTARFAGMPGSVDSLATGLGATHVLSGSVRADAAGLMIFAQLVRVSDRKHLFAKRVLDAPESGRVSAIGDTISIGVLRVLTPEP